MNSNNFNNALSITVDIEGGHYIRSLNGSPFARALLPAFWFNEEKYIEPVVFARDMDLSR